jgi:hypothetical protein
VGQAQPDQCRGAARGGCTGPRARQGRPLNRGAAFTRTAAGSGLNAITMASVMVDEIRLRAHARPVISDDD